MTLGQINLVAFAKTFKAFAVEESKHFKLFNMPNIGSNILTHHKSPIWVNAKFYFFSLLGFHFIIQC